MKTIILVGIPGSGKTSILKEIARQSPSITIVNYGDKMLEAANAQGLTRDMLRKMPISAQQEIGIRAAKQIMQGKDEITIIDTHALIKTEVGFCPGPPKEVLKTLSKNVEITKKILTELIDKIPKTRNCSCAKALEEAEF